MRTPKAGLLVAIVAAVALLVVPAGADAEGARQFVLSPEGNHLWAYEAETGEPQLLVRAENGEDPGVGPDGLQRRDVNGQVCVSPDGRHFIAGEDTVVAARDGGDGAGSHDPRIAGWGFFEISEPSPGKLDVAQVGKLAPEAGPGHEAAGYAGDPDNYGCGFLDQNRLFTTAIGNTYPGQPANGQLFLWFGPFDAGYRSIASTQTSPGFFVGEVAHCEIDRTLATAGGVAVDSNGDLYVATNRPDDSGNPGGVWRYRPRAGETWPTTLAECTPEAIERSIEKVQIIPALGAGPLPELRSPTPSAVAISPANTLYLSSVFSGTVSEYTKAGAWVRDVYPASPVAPRTGPTSETPYGIAFTADGSLWIADLGIVVGAPAPGMGSVIRVRFDEAGEPQPFGERIKDGLTFPDGLGVYTAQGVGAGA